MNSTEPAWLVPIKEAARLRARAQGVAQVHAAREESHPHLQIANPSSSILSSAATSGHADTPSPFPRSNPLDTMHESRLELGHDIELDEEASDATGTVILKAAPARPTLDGLPSSSDAPEASTDIQLSLETLEKGAAAAIYFEQLYHGILKRPRGRDERHLQLEKALTALSAHEQEHARAAWLAAETEYLRDLRSRVHVGSFAKLKCIGHGAFGVVNLVQERHSGELFAMKQLRKADMLRKGQEGHVRAERDFMSQAASGTRHIVRLAYSFQDVDHLYLVMEWMGGGDMLNMLIEKDVFDEGFARFYVAEMILAIEETREYLSNSTCLDVAQCDALQTISALSTETSSPTTFCSTATAISN